MSFCSPLLAARVWLLVAKQPMYDFMTYWSAGHLFLTGGHPYSVAAMGATEVSLGWPITKLMMMLCPPWSLPIVAVLALPSFETAHSLWRVASIMLNISSSLVLWRYFGGSWQKSWIAILVAATFLPMGAAEFLGQITPLMLGSLTAFLLLLRHEWKFTAGIMLLGFGFKPQLLYLVALAILFWVISRQEWKVLAGGTMSYGVAIGAALLINPNSMDYLQSSYGSAIQTSCGFGGGLRSIFGMQHTWLQFLPSLVGVSWLVYFWARNKDHWNWQMHLPLLLMISICTSPYYWYHDLILILPAMISVAVQVVKPTAALLLAYMVVQAIILLLVHPSAPLMSVASVLWIPFYFFAKSSSNSRDCQALRTIEAQP